MVTTMSPEFTASSEKRSSVHEEKHNICVIIPPKADIVAEAIERKGHNWFVCAEVTSDLLVQIGKENSFHLHMLPMVSRSGYLNRMAFQSRNNGNTKPIVQLNSLPGGSVAFEIVVKFCYGWRLHLTPNNVAPLHCAAHFLEMTDQYEPSNLVSKTEAFIAFLMLSSWKDTFRVLKSCEGVSSYAKDLQIETRCLEAIAWKVCTTHDEGRRLKICERWWFEDLSCLRIDHFIEVVALIGNRNLCTKRGSIGVPPKPALLGSCIVFWTANWLSKTQFHNPTQKTTISHHARTVIESLVRILPVEENSVSCNFLLHLLKVGTMTNIDSGLSAKLEKRIVLMLEKCQPADLLVRSYGEGVTLYDVKSVVRVVEAYVCSVSGMSESKMSGVAKLMDGFLAMVATDPRLPVQDFAMLVEVLPKNARRSDDNFYKAIDMYLKAHPQISTKERKVACRAMEYHKLSKEAKEHALKNERLPLDMMARFVLLEQLNMAQSVIASGLCYEIIGSQAVARGDTDERNGLMESRKEANVVKLEVESLKVELGKVQVVKMDIKRMANLGI